MAGTAIEPLLGVSLVETLGIVSEIARKPIPVTDLANVAGASYWWSFDNVHRRTCSAVALQTAQPLVGVFLMDLPDVAGLAASMADCATLPIAGTDHEPHIGNGPMTDDAIGSLDMVLVDLLEIADADLLPVTGHATVPFPRLVHVASLGDEGIVAVVALTVPRSDEAQNRGREAVRVTRGAVVAMNAGQVG